MPFRDIPQEEWRGVCDELSAKQKGTPVTVELVGADAGTRELARDLPLEGIVAERKRGNFVVEVMLGDAPDRHLSHVVTRPLHLKVRENEAGEHDALLIEGENRATMTILFGQTQED